MPVGYVWEIPGATTEMYDRVVSELGLTERPIAGLLCHAVGPVEGGLSLIEVWESTDAFERFFANRLDPVLAIVYMPQARITRFEIHHFITRPVSRGGAEKDEC